MIYDVAIVGFGPSGVVAAGLLGQMGLTVYACDRLEEVYDIPRAISLDHEIQRVFQELGVMEAIAPYCEPFTPSEYFGVDGQLIRRMTMVAPPYPQGHVPSIVFSQPPVERALRVRVAQLPNVTVASGVECTGVSQDAEGVTLEVRPASTKDNGQNCGQSHVQDNQQSRLVRARYGIACDGGASSLRSQLGIVLEDLDFDEPWLVVDVLVNPQGLAKLPKVSVQYCEPERPCTLVIGPGNHRRWEISILPHENPQELATPERTWELLSRWLSPDDGELWRQASYRFHALVADRWRVGRWFVAGDAAHMQPPFLGQGMCQGIRDVANLSWKLQAVLSGKVQPDAAESLLDSYAVERKAHVRELTSRIKGVGAVICERDARRARERDARLLAEGGGKVRDMPRQDILPRLEGGCLAQEDHPARGTLFPQPRLRHPAGELLMDDLFGRGWRLVSLEPLASLASELTNGLELVALQTTQIQESEGVAQAWFQRFGAIAALVRPDHYVFGVAGNHLELEALLAQWQQRLTRQQVITSAV